MTESINNLSDFCRIAELFFEKHALTDRNPSNTTVIEVNSECPEIHGKYKALTKDGQSLYFDPESKNFTYDSPCGIHIATSFDELHRLALEKLSQSVADQQRS